MNPDNERISDLPGKQVQITFDTDLGVKFNKNNAAAINSAQGGLVGLRFLVDGTVSLSLIFDTVPGPAFPVFAGDVYVGRIKQVHAVGTTLTPVQMIGLA